MIVVEMESDSGLRRVETGVLSASVDSCGYWTLRKEHGVSVTFTNAWGLLSLGEDKRTSLDD